MREALVLAAEAAEAGEVPVGAVVVRHGEIVGRGRNRRESGGGAAAHAEIEAITEACRALGGWRLSGCELYVTLEPCPMCAGAVVNARLDRVVYGAHDARGGALGGLFDLTSYPLGCRPLILGGVLESECTALLRDFFAARRKTDGKPRRLLREFYSVHADELAPLLLGKVLCRRDPESGEVSGRASPRQSAISGKTIPPATRIAARRTAHAYFGSAAARSMFTCATVCTAC